MSCLVTDWLTQSRFSSFPVFTPIWKPFRVFLDIALIKRIGPMENGYKQKSVLFLKKLL